MFVKTDVAPSFPSGEREWRRYLERNLDASVPSKNGCKSGSFTVLVQFIVDKDGSIREVKALTKNGYGMESEVVQIIRSGPKWTPGMQNGKIVKAFKLQPITFVIGNGKPGHSTEVLKKYERKDYLLKQIWMTSFESNENKVFEKLDVQPKFSGGDTAWRRFLEKNIDVNVPVKNGAPAGSYKVELQFIVNIDGSITDLKIISNKGFGMEEECLRMMKLSPNWLPATVKGKKVAAYKIQPITFVVAED